MNLKTVLCTSLLAIGITSASAQELIVNGDFEDVEIPGYAAQISVHQWFFDENYGDAALNGGTMSQGVQGVHGWTSNGGYNFLMTPGSATGQGAATIWNDYLTFWSPSNGGTSSIEIPDTSPTGGNFIALDSAYSLFWEYMFWNDEPVTEPIDLTISIDQTISGLEIGQQYELTFWWAAAQQHGYDGDTWDSLKVSFGDEQFETETLLLPEHGYADWRQERVVFTASTTSQILSFLASGGPDGQPPFVFLDGISMVAVPVPEASTLAMLGLGATGLIFARRRFLARRKKE